MARTKGSGWGGGTLLYQKCPYCGKKKAVYSPLGDFSSNPFRCTACKKWFASETLYRLKYKIQFDALDEDGIPTVATESISEYEQRTGRGFWGNATTGYIYDKDNK
jgi:hypothetical protein